LWGFVKILNALRPKETFSRPYLSKEELRNDGKLLSKLISLGNKLPGKYFLIHRQEVVEHLCGHYVTWYTLKKE
jgi:hypothetical protein